jgi:DnaJ-class molecular chaperone
MPTVAEKARAEADQVEAEETEEQPDQQDPSTEQEEQETPVEPHPGEGLEEPSDQMVAELQAACDEHHDRVHAIMGPFVEGWTPCEACNGIGLDLARDRGPKLEHSQGAATCSVCKGYGELLTGSKRQGYEKIQCANCSGQGWVGQGNMPAATAAQQAVEQYPTADGQQVTMAQPAPPPSTDPRVEELRAAGYIVLEKPGS